MFGLFIAAIIAALFGHFGEEPLMSGVAIGILASMLILSAI